MRKHILLSALLVAAAASAGAQASKAPMKAPAAAMQLPAGIAGTWEGKSMTGPKDSVITQYVNVITADGKGWTTKLTGRDAMAVRIIAAGGDSVVTEMGPYNSILRPGTQVTTRQTTHFKGETSMGTFEAKFSNGDVVKGKSSGKRTKM